MNATTTTSISITFRSSARDGLGRRVSLGRFPCNRTWHSPQNSPWLATFRLRCASITQTKWPKPIGPQTHHSKVREASWASAASSVECPRRDAEPGTPPRWIYWGRRGNRTGQSLLGSARITYKVISINVVASVCLSQKHHWNRGSHKQLLRGGTCRFVSIEVQRRRRRRQECS